MSVGCCIASVAASVTAASVRVAVANRSPASIAVDRVVVVALLRVVEGARRGAIARARGIVVVVASVIAPRRIARVVLSSRGSIAIRDRVTVSARIDTN
jgi:hypothetical protein